MRYIVERAAGMGNSEMWGPFDSLQEAEAFVSKIRGDTRIHVLDHPQMCSHVWVDTGFANLEECARCRTTRPAP